MKEQDYKTTARSRLTDRHRSDDTFLAILDTLVEIKAQRQKQYLDIADALLDIDKSEGKNLDLIGKLIGEERTLVNFIDRSYFGFLGARLSESYDIGYWYSLYKNKYGTLRTLTDAEYRRVLKARVVKNSSDNNRNSFLEVLNILLDNDSAVIVESENNTAIEVRIKDIDGLASYYLSKYKSDANLIPMPLGRRLGVVHTEQDAPTPTTTRPQGVVGTRLGNNDVGLFNVYAGTDAYPTKFGILSRAIVTDTAAITFDTEAVGTSFRMVLGYRDYTKLQQELIIDSKNTYTTTTQAKSIGSSIGVSSVATIGAEINTPSSPFKGDICCVLIGTNPLTQTEKDKLFGWAAHKYGLTANLPSGHPYKTLVPTV